MAAAPASPTSDLSLERDQYRLEVQRALEEDADPLAAYERFVKWTADAYRGRPNSESRFTELLHEVTHKFKEDAAYRTDLRYLQMWSLYASRLPKEKQAKVYRGLVKAEIGVPYAQLWEEFASILERDGHHAKADEIYRMGITRRARPLERLKKRYADFLARHNKTKPVPSFAHSPSSTSTSAATHAPSTSTSASASATSTLILTSTTRTEPPLSLHGHNRYAPLLTPNPPGRRPERLMCDLSLIWDPATQSEWSFAEARARSQGLLNKKWPPLVSDASATSTSGGRDTTVKVHFADGGKNATRTGGGARKSLAAEPTVTINTKEALADVFGMYNSPEKSMRLGPAAGSKHAPLKKIEPLTPGTLAPPPLTRSHSASSVPDPKTPGSIRPFVDENEHAHTTPAPVKTPLSFRPFVDNAENEVPATAKTPGPSDPHTVVRTQSDENAHARTPFRPYVDGAENPPLKTPSFKPLHDAAADENGGGQGITPGPTLLKFQPFVDGAQPNRTPAAVFTPGVRRALAEKTAEPTPRPNSEQDGDGANAASENWPKTPAGGGVLFSRGPGTAAVFTPAPASAAAAPTSSGAHPKPGPLGDVFSAPPAASGPKTPGAFTPFADTQTPFKVFVRPGAGVPNGAMPTPTPVCGAFRPLRHREEEQENAPVATAAVEEPEPEDPPTVTITQDPTRPPGLGAIREDDEEEERSESPPEGEADVGMFVKGHDHDTDTTESETDGSQDHHVEFTPLDEPETEEDSMMEDPPAEYARAETSGDQSYEGPETPDLHPAEYDEEEEEGRHAVLQPLGRFGAFTVMTPVMERTFEFTMSAQLEGTPLGHVEGRILEGLDDQAVTEVSDLLTRDLRQTSGNGNALGLEDVHGEDRPYASAGDEDAGADDAVPASTSFVAVSTLPEPCNPFDPQRLATLMSLIPAVPGYHDLKRDDAHLLDGLQKFAKKLGQSSSSALAAPYFRFEIEGRRFGVYDKLGEGGFGAVFAAKDLTDLPVNEDMEEEDDEDEEDEAPRFALKVVRPRNVWEYHVLHRLHAVLPDHLRRSVIVPHALYAYRDESFFVMDLCAQGTLLDMVNRAAETGISRQGACMDELLIFFFTIELMRLVEGMHRAGFVHGDLKIDNCLIRLDPVPGGDANLAGTYRPDADGWLHKGIKLIDFGRTIDTRLFPAGQAFVSDWNTDARDCREMRERLPWTFQPDYHGLADIVYCMLFGRYMDDASLSHAASPGERVKLATPLKRYWQIDLWSRLFDLLLNPSLAGELPLCDELAELRQEMEIWLEANSNRSGVTLKSLLKRIERACTAQR